MTQVARREIVIKTEYWDATLSNRGAVATSWILKKYPEDGHERELQNAEGKTLELIPQTLPDHLSGPFSLRLPWSPEFATQLNESNFAVEGVAPGENEITIKPGEQREIIFTFAGPKGVARKSFTFSEHSFLLDVRASVTVNGVAQPVELVLGPRIGDQSDVHTSSYSLPPQVVVLTREGKREQIPGAKITPQFATATSVDHSSRQIVIDKPLAPDVDSVKLVADKGARLIGYCRVVEASPDRRTLTLDSLPEEASNGVGVAQGTDTLRQGYNWAGVADHYFAMLAVGDQMPISHLTLTNFEIKGSDKSGTPIDYPAASVPFAGDAPLHVFVGPKQRELLTRLSGELGVDLGALIDWGMFSFAVKPLIPVLAWALKGLASAFGNFGWAIVVVTVLINLALSPLRLYSSTKMKKAAKHQPRLKELQERMKKLKENPKKNERELLELQQEQLAIMKEANPLGGCMPMLLQMPIFWAVYLYLGSALDVRHAPWLGWITDLSKPDRLYILPIVMCVTMIASTQLTPQPPSTDPSMKMQRMMMTWFMPILLTYFFFFSAPSGLVLYWMVSNLIGVLIQLVINKKTAHLTAAQPPVSSKTGGSKKSGKGKSVRRPGDAEAEGF
jgi:YidC/Oxa1 family membrane protein insertase